MNNFKVGDFVYFSLSNEDSIKLFECSGVLFNISDDKYSILKSSSGSNYIYNVSISNIRPLSDRENIINEINTYYDNKVEKYQLQIKSVKRDFYNDEIVSKYNTLKEEILNTAKNMIINTNDDEEFENKLKAICQKKKQLFAIECEGMNDARKHNGEIKYNIKITNKQRDDKLKYLDNSINELKRKI